MHSQASTLGGNEPVVASYDDDDDRVPLEAYGDAFYSEDNGADANVAEAGSAASSSMADTSIPQTASPINEPVLQADTSTDSSAVQTDTPTGDEASRIKSILSNSFGEGIKFEEL